MKFIGIDIGSTCAKTVVMNENKEIVLEFVQPTGWSSVDTAEEIRKKLVENDADPAENVCVATGYGRVSVPYADKMITVLFEQNNMSKARQYCQKAIETNPDYGAPYILIGNMYAKSAKSIYPNDAVLAKAVYYAAIDKFEKARQVDQNVAEDAGKLANTYRAHLPSTEEVFMHPDLEKGKAFKIGGWIGETVTIR